MYGIYLKKEKQTASTMFLPIFRPDSKPLRQGYNISPSLEIIPFLIFLFPEK